MAIASVVTRGFGSGGSIPFVVTRGYGIGEAAPVVEAVILGGDDVPRKSPHKGWDRSEHKKRQDLDKALRDDIRSIYRKLRGIPELREKAQEVVKPFAFDGQFPSADNIDWALLQQTAEIQLRMMWIAKERLIEEEEIPVLMEILGAIL